ncbi:hypothetical protein P152DRAFT_392316 [Eremomyces bilateralis CBS 781.70]|uniref:Uncharacterized protein n=1 Tax=Eremomyces bilateralis CBS 781.70 TaxID=1392243 RepID=A0A6G1G9R7_9PEZI|nr:uncharacterized protein P152DRAFT_392316 [Eremomyces bilateralis CBS 781.70]KAF1814686.1 hypothetical protein P152DRAFT_392316 [Eremomyces bilateralis CBS 781.70]
MASEQSVPTNDLRSESMDSKRDHDHKSKWAHGKVTGRGQGPNAHGRPMTIHRNEGVIRSHRLAKTALKQDVRDEGVAHHSVPVGASPSGSSSDEHAKEVIEPSAAPEPDAEITYSFDAAKGPGHGSQLLSMAVEQAVERFENEETEKIVRTEYDLLEAEGVAVPFVGKGKEKKTAGKKEKKKVEDEYEFV